ncbi:hypothetical protein ASD24_24240, partial [Paenibacillus sp. Root52]|uniref:hypothetical protein n=1 Tax=Paenibacillus sp. Root52 TaxID=1736552 RepID=UPI000700A48E
DYQYNSKKYEKNKKKIIETLGSINGTYLTVLFDSQTANYLERISQSIYELERSFRNLIEIKMLRKIGPTWGNQYLGSNESTHDRKNNRKDDIFRFLSNPLDDYNFKNLGSFVKENISKNKNELIVRIESLDRKLDELGKKKNKIEFNEIINEIFNEINNLKNSIGSNRSLFSSDIYSHIKPDLVDDWDRIYEIRNYWAHNIFLMTEMEYSEYERLRKSINKKILVELTIDSLLGVENIKDYGENTGIRFTISKYESDVVHCEIKIKIKIDEKILYVSKLEADYTDIQTFYDILFESDTNLKELNKVLYKSNPYLLPVLFENKEQESFLQSINEDELGLIVNELKKNFNVKTENESGEGLVAVNEDHHNYLKSIFSPNN